MNRNMEAMTWALHARGISPTAFRLLIQLCSYVSSSRGDFEVWPSHKRMAEAVEISVSGVKRHLKELVDAALLEIRPGQRKDGGTSSNVYSIAVRSQHRMPDGRTVEVEQPPVQSGRGVEVTGEHGWQATPDLCSEPLNSEPLNKENPPLPSEEAPPGGLFDGVMVEAGHHLPIEEYVITEWKRLVEQYPRIQMPRVLSASRKKKIAARADDVARGAGGAITAHDVWREVFAAIRASDFLRGEAPPTRNYPTPFSLSIDYILRPAEFLRTLERAMIDGEDTRATSDPSTGRRFGPTEQSGREALRRFLAREAGRQ